MDLATITLNLATNADLYEVQPVVDADGAAVDMTTWPFCLELKANEWDAAPLLTVTVAVTAVGELTFSADKDSIAGLLATNMKKRALVGDLLTRPDNGSYVARIAVVKAVVTKGVSTL
jgi:hypothetical protein